MRGFAAVTLNYRWPETEDFRRSYGITPPTSTPSSTDSPSQLLLHSAVATTESVNNKTWHLRWPTPLHDILFGYEWITQNLAPSPDRTRRDIYVVGSHLGAGLAASLALTESHSHQPVAVRGFAAYNGIYNWTAFLPQHPRNRGLVGDNTSLGELIARGGLATSSSGITSSALRYLVDRMPDLFTSPANLFDPFASPALFFHSPGLHIPPDFDGSSASASDIPTHLSQAIDQLSTIGHNPNSPSPSPSSQDDEERAAAAEAAAEAVLKPPRKGYYAFPPRQSSLKIPETLLLHDNSGSGSGMTLPNKKQKKNKKSKPVTGGGGPLLDFAAQADELASLMRRSVNVLELKERAKWDEELEDWEHEALRRVRVAAVPGDTTTSSSTTVRKKSLDGLGFGERENEVLGKWIEEMMDRR